MKSFLKYVLGLTIMLVGSLTSVQHATVTTTVAACTLPHPQNYILIKEEEGITSRNYPIQIARPFLEGEIQNYPQAVIAGFPVKTQADVKQRYPDGSVRHAIITFLIPEIKAHSRIQVNFQNQSSGLNDHKLSQADMLDPAFDFDAKIALTTASTQTASARQMLENGDFDYWMEGPVATSIILADHSIDRKYDMGWEREFQTRLTATIAPQDMTLPVVDASGFTPGSVIQVGIEHMRINTVDTEQNILTLSERGVNNSHIKKQYNNSFVATTTWKEPTNPKYKAFRPIFHATFWPTIHKVRVRYIGEIANTEAYQDLHYSLRLYKGQQAGKPIYAKDQFYHVVESRWTKEFWIGGEPSGVSIDHNIHYLKATKFVPNYDTSKIISEKTIQRAYENWLTTKRDLYDPGHWRTYMQGTGGRPEVGLHPEWTVRWLYTGDWRLREIALRQAELAGAWRTHKREGDPTKLFDRTQAVPALGKVLSLVARPTFGYRLDYHRTREEDRIVPVGVYETYGPIFQWPYWAPDLAHRPDPFSVQYMLTGDYWFLEEMYFWASDAAAENKHESRGPHGYNGGITSNYQVRAEAWVTRNRIHLVSLAPDDHLEKTYFKKLLEDSIAIWEGTRNITDTSFYKNEYWQWGQNNYAPYRYGDKGLPPLHIWDIGATTREGETSDKYDTSVVAGNLGSFQHYFIILVLGRAEELGFPTTALKAWVGQSLIGQLTDPNYDPYMLANYLLLTRKKAHGSWDWFQSWKEEKNATLPEYRAQAQVRFEEKNADTYQGYTNVALTATSYVADLPGGEQAWDFMKKHALGHPNFNISPKWAIVPRSTPEYQLTVTKTAKGEGIVKSNMSGIYCGTSCRAKYYKGTVVALQAVNPLGTKFTGWSGAGCNGTQDTCIITMDTAKHVTASFEDVDIHTLRVAKSGTGAGEVHSDIPGIQCGTLCRAEYNADTVIILRAQAERTSVFTGWSGGSCHGTDACKISLRQSETITATFENLPTSGLSVEKQGTGTGTVVSDSQDIHCGDTCSEVWGKGSIVKLTAIPNADSSFAGWQGDRCSGLGTCEVRLTTDLTVKPKFVALSSTLHWGQDRKLPKMTYYYENTALGGMSPSKNDIKITALSVYLAGGSTQNVYFAIYSGGQSESNPHGAKLLWETGAVNAADQEGWFTIEHPKSGVVVPRNIRLWIAWKKPTRATLYYSDRRSDAGDFFPTGSYQDRFDWRTRFYNPKEPEHNEVPYNANGEGIRARWYSVFLSYENIPQTP